MENIYKAVGIGIIAAAVLAIVTAKVFARELSVPEYYETGSDRISSYIDIGNIESESKNDFDIINGSIPQTRIVDSREFSYRTLDKDGVMLLNLKCSPDEVNYLTVQLWGGDVGDGILWVCDPISKNMNTDDTRPPQRDAGIADRRDWVELNYVGSTPQEYAEGLISNRNSYYPGTERYPIDIYSALTLENDTALKIISNYLTQQDIKKLAQKNNTLDSGNSHYEDNILDSAYLYTYFDEIIQAAKDRYIDEYSFAMENDDILSFAWADEMARNIVIKDGNQRIYMALNWRNPAYSTTLYNTMYDENRQSVRANNLCRVHAVGKNYDRYGYAAMSTDGYSDWTAISGTDGVMEALMTVRYGEYSIIMNSYNCSGNGNTKDFNSEAFEELLGLDRSMSYKDMISGRLYTYSGGFWHSDGYVLKSESNSTLVLKVMQDLKVSDRRISEHEISAVITNDLSVPKKVTVYAASYLENGELKEVKSNELMAAPGNTEVTVEMDSPQKIFVWDENNKPI